MTDIEQFLASRKYYRCERLRASLTKEQCQQNRTRQASFVDDIYEIGACKDCPGLGEETAMASIIGTCKECKREEMTLPGGGLCGKCYTNKRKAEGKIPQKILKKNVKLQPKPVAEPMTAATVSQPEPAIEAPKPQIAEKNCNSVTINLMDIIDQAWDERRAELEKKLMFISDPYLQMKQAHETVTWLRSL